MTRPLKILALAALLSFAPSAISCSHASESPRPERRSVASGAPKGNQRVTSFRKAKDLLADIHSFNGKTLYCGCNFSGTTVDLASCGYKPRAGTARSKKMEWEHVVPAESFGKAFPEWRNGAPQCISGGKPYKGRRCAGTNPDFVQMEADLFNLWPEIGELNAMRSNFTMAAIGGPGGEFGRCDVRIKSRKFEPSDAAKGIVARIYLYMEYAYPGRGIVAGKNQQLFEAWDRLYPVTDWECDLANQIAQVQGNRNAVLDNRCSRRSTVTP